MLCKDPHHWVSACSLIAEESRRAAAQRTKAIAGYPARGPMVSPGAAQRKHLSPGGALAIEGESPQPSTSHEVTQPGEQK